MADEEHDHSATANQTSPTDKDKQDKGFSSSNSPRAPSGLGSDLQPSGTIPGGGPGASAGSIGTGGGQTESRDSGSLKRDGR